MADRQVTAMKGITLAICTLGSIIGIARVGLWPTATPIAKEINPEIVEQLKENGWNTTKAGGPRIGHEISTGQSFSLTMQQHADNGIRVLLVPVRPRGAASLGSEKLKQLVEKRAPQKAKNLKIGSDQLGLSTTTNKKTTITTCVSQEGEASNDGNQLREIIKKEPISLLRRIKIIVGVEPPRDWSCLYVRMDIAQDSGAVPTAWKKLRESLTSRNLLL
jgi:hypothetical protein